MATELPDIDVGALTAMNVAVVMIHDKIIADATASSGKNAKVKACQVALRMLDGLAPFEYRSQFCCNCDASNEEHRASLGEAIGTAI